MVGERARELHGRDRACLASHIVASLNQAGGPDVEELRRISAEHGLLSRALRRRVWPILLNIPTDRWGNLVREDGSRLDDGDGRLVLSPREHPEKKQVELDVVRSLSHFGMRARDRSARLPQLTILITSVLKSDPSLHYYQGFNDVCSIALLVMGSEAAARPVAESLAKHHFRAAMFENMEAVQQAIRLIVGIVAKRDPPLARYQLQPPAPLRVARSPFLQVPHPTARHRGQVSHRERRRPAVRHLLDSDLVRAQPSLAASSGARL
jgi:hypothetical protein